MQFYIELDLPFSYTIMSAKVVAVAGASGFVGTAFLDAFLELEPLEIRILTRASSVSLFVPQS